MSEIFLYIHVVATIKLNRQQIKLLVNGSCLEIYIYDFQSLYC